MAEDVHGTTERLREWAGELLTDHRLGVPPDAQLRVLPSSSITIGHLSEYRDTPEAGVRTRGFNLRFCFRDDAPPDLIDGVGDRIAHELGEDPTLGGRFQRGVVEFAGAREGETEQADDPAYPVVRIVRVRVREHVRAA